MPELSDTVADTPVGAAKLRQLSAALQLSVLPVGTKALSEKPVPLRVFPLVRRPLTRPTVRLLVTVRYMLPKTTGRSSSEKRPVSGQPTPVLPDMAVQLARGIRRSFEGRVGP